ncbi:MAG: Gfo/Idh/MocA family oxidoreductase [Candidatus Bathyarchaeia archaeon]
MIYMKTVGVGIIGCGSIGKYHIDRCLKLSEAKVVAVCDIDKQALREVKEKFKIENLYVDYHDLLDRKDVEAVIVSLPNYLHAPVTIDALKSGKHVLCEKPPALNARQVEEMFATSRKAGRKLVIGLTRRFSNTTRVLKKYVGDGVLGEVYLAKCGYLRRTGIPGMGSWFTTKSLAGSGAVFDIGVHALDMTFWIMDDFKVKSVYASTYAKFGPKGKAAGDWGKPVPGGPFDVEDLGVSLIKMESGATIYLEAAWASFAPKAEFYVHLLGDAGGLEYPAMNLITEEEGKIVTKKIECEEREDPYLVEMRHFIVDCILKDEEPITKPEEMILLQKTLDAILESAEEGEEVKVC